MTHFSVDDIRAQLGRGQSISMDQFNTVLTDGVLRRQNPSVQRRFSSSDLKSKYKSTNGMPRRFAFETISQNPKPKPAIPVLDEETKSLIANADRVKQRFNEVKENYYRELTGDLRRLGFSDSDIELFHAGRKALDARMRQEAEDALESEVEASEPETAGDVAHRDALYELNHSFKFGHKPGPKHYEKNHKKKHSLR